MWSASGGGRANTPGWGAGAAAALGGAALGAAAGLSLSDTSWDLFGADQDHPDQHPADGPGADDLPDYDDHHHHDHHGGFQ